MSAHDHEPWDEELRCLEGHRVKRWFGGWDGKGPMKGTKVRLGPPGLDTPYVCEICPKKHHRRDLLPPLTAL